MIDWYDHGDYGDQAKTALCTMLLAQCVSHFLLHVKELVKALYCIGYRTNSKVNIPWLISSQ